MRPVLTQTLYSSPIIACFFLHFLLPGHVCFTYISSILKGRNHFFTTACTSQALGIASSSAILDNSFTASSTHSGYQPSKARLNGAGAWAPSTNSGADFLQIDLGAVHFICAVATQGNPTADEWTKNYKIKMSINKVDWSEYKEGNPEKVCSCQLNKTSFGVKQSITRSAVHVKELPHQITYLSLALILLLVTLLISLLSFVLSSFFSSLFPLLHHFLPLIFSLSLPLPLIFFIFASHRLALYSPFHCCCCCCFCCCCLGLSN